MNTNCRTPRIYQTEIYWENSAIRTFPCGYCHDVSEDERVVALADVEKQRFQEAHLRNEFDINPSNKNFRSLAAILFGSLIAGLTGCKMESLDISVQDTAPAAQISEVEVIEAEPAPAASSQGENLRVTSGRSLPLPPAMQYGS